MKARLGSIAFLLSSVAVGISWLSLQPSLVQLLDAVRRLAPDTAPEAENLARIQGLLPYYLALDLLLPALIGFALLYFAVGRPLLEAEGAIEQLGRLDLSLTPPAKGGALVARMQAALTRVAEALKDEQTRTRSQLASLREAHAKLARAQTELVASERLATVGKLAAGVAHEVGNPLSGILGYLSIVRAQAKGNPEVREYIDRIDSEVQRINQIVRGLLELGRAADVALVPVDVEPIVQTCVRLVRVGPEFAKVNVVVDATPGVVARVDPAKLSQVLLNLVINAAQALSGLGEIRVRVRREGSWVMVEVEDTGPGIPPEVMPRLFEPFFSTKLPGKGTGLGLAVSKHLAGAMGGDVTAANGANGGALFTVRLQAA